MKAILLLAFLACCYAFPVINDLAINTASPVSIVLDGPVATDMKLFKFYMPHNASAITFMVTNTNTSACSYLQMWLRVGESPCPEGEDDTPSVCNDAAWTDGGYITDTTKSYSFDPSKTFSGFRWAVDSWWFVGFDKDSDNDDYCTMVINSVTTTFCGAGTVATYDSDNTLVCLPENALTFGTQAVVTGETAITKVFSTQLTGYNYGHIQVIVNASTSSLDLYAKSGSPASNDDSGITYDCYENSYDNDGAFYIYTLYCATPIGGTKWYLSLIYDDTPAYSATITATAQTCGAGTGGFNCSAQLISFNPKTPSATVGPYTIPANSVAYSTYSFLYFYYDVNTTVTQNSFTFVISSISAGASGYSYLRHNAFPEYSTPYGYSFSAQYSSLSTSSSTTWNVYEGDLANNARIYFGIGSFNSVALTFTLNSTVTTTGNPTTQNPTTANPTTGNPTTANPTTGDTGGSNSASSGVSTLVASFVLVLVAMIAALL